MRKKNLTKAVETTVAPNPKEVDIWVEPKDDDTVSLKYYDYHDKEWVGSGDDYEDTYQYYRIDRDIYNVNVGVDTLPGVILAKGIYDNDASPVNGTKIISSPYEIGAAMIEQVMCYNGKSIIGDKEINEGDWKKNVSEHLFILLGPFEDHTTSIQTPEDILNILNYLVPITKEEFYSLEP